MRSSSGASHAPISIKTLFAKGVDDYRLKKVQGKKKRDAEAAEAKRIAEAPHAEAAAIPTPVDNEETSGSGDLLSSKDEDIIF